jgi:hypothetical protein
MNALDAEMLELFVKPKAGASEPKPLKGGRKKSRIKRSENSRA